MAIIKLSAIERRRLSVFITCLVLAAAAWVFVALSQDHVYVIKQAVSFKNLPQRRAFHSMQSDTVDVTIHGNGWQMLFSKMQPGNLGIDVATLDRRNYVVLSKQLSRLNAGRDSSNMIVSISPDTLYFDFTNRMVKRVPVNLIYAVTYQRQFGLSDSIDIKPANVLISGPANRVMNIKSWPTDSLKLRNLNESYSTRINLRPVNDGSLTVLSKTAEITIPVDEFTEKTLQIPVKLLNLNYDNVKIFPQKVKLIITVSLSKYAETNESLFEATADMDLWRNKGYTTLPITITRKPQFCKVVSVEPGNIDFIVKK